MSPAKRKERYSPKGGVRRHYSDTTGSKVATALGYSGGVFGSLREYCRWLLTQATGDMTGLDKHGIGWRFSTPVRTENLIWVMALGIVAHPPIARHGHRGAL